MGAVSGIWNQSTAGTNPLAHANPMSTGSGSSASSGSDASTISANDFLTLLVTEMKNQDPTASTDPNEYINQLVQVNSLEQLIDINQNLSTALGSSTTSTTPGVVAGPVGAPQISPAAGANAKPAVQRGSPSAMSATSGIQAQIRTPVIGGNLAAPDAVPAAHQVAQALSGRK